MLLYKKLRYLYFKKQNDPVTLMQDIISEKTGFIPYEIILYRKDCKHYTFNYKGVCYALLGDELKVISEDDI